MRSETGEIAFEEPVDGPSWKLIPAVHYSYLIYLHGKDHPREHWPETGNRVHERIKAWRYQVDYAQDAGNLIRDGGGADNIAFLSGFDVFSNNPDPQLSDLYIETDPALGGARGAWVVRVRVAVPSQLLLANRDTYWGLLRALYAVSPAPPPGSPDEEILAWQAEPATQEAYQAWHLTTMQFSPGTIRAIAADEATCNWRVQTNCVPLLLEDADPQPQRTPLRGRRLRSATGDRRAGQHRPRGLHRLQQRPRARGQGVRSGTLSG